MTKISDLENHDLRKVLEALLDYLNVDVYWKYRGDQPPIYVVKERVLEVEQIKKVL